MIVAASHLHDILNTKKLKTVVRHAVKTLRKVEFDFIACRGLSGTTFASIVAYRLNKPLVIVRKGEQCHSWLTVENARPGNYIILDDLICSGETIEKIIEAINQQLEANNVANNATGQANLCGIYLYTKNSAGDYSRRRFGCPVWSP